MGGPLLYFHKCTLEIERQRKQASVCESHAVCVPKSQPKSEPSVTFPAALEHIFVWL